MSEALARLPVVVIQSTSDEGRGLVKYVREDLGVHHSPDVFHVQHDLVKATCGPLASRRRQAKKANDKAVVQTQKQKEECKRYRSEEKQSVGQSC